MRVAIIVKEFPPDSIGGLQTQTKRMATALAESEEVPDVVLFTKRYRRHDNDAELPFEVVRVPQLGISPFVSDLTFLLGCFLALVWHSRRIDVLQCMTIYPIGFLGLMVNRVTGVPYFAWIRGNDFYQMRAVSWKRWMIRQVLADTRVLVQSSEIEADVRQYFSDLEPNIGILGNGINVPDETSSLEDPVVLYVGRLAPKKGVRYLIEAVEGANSEFVLWIVGDGSERERLERQAVDANREIQFFGEVLPEEVADRYLAASVLVLPSIEGEGMPNAILEAMAHGLPVVATPSGGVPSLIEDGHNGMLVPMANSAAIGKSIDKLLTDQEYRYRIGMNARSYVENNHSWGTLVNALLIEYDRLIG